MTDSPVEALAYGLWENEGRPDGRADEFWFLAEILLAAPDAYAAPTVTPKLAPTPL